MTNNITTTAQQMLSIEIAYIYSQLYKAEFIKSKPISITNYSGDLRNKCMHIIKYKIKSIVLDNANYFENVNFQYANMKISLNTYNNFLNVNKNPQLLNGFVRIFNNNIDQNMKKFFTVSYDNYSTKIIYQLSFIYPNNTENIKESLDDFINALMYIPISFNIIFTFIRDYLNRDPNRVYSLYDLFLLGSQQRIITNLIPEVNIEDFKEIIIDNISSLANLNLISYLTLHEILRQRNMLIENNQERARLQR